MGHNYHVEQRDVSASLENDIKEQRLLTHATELFIESWTAHEVANLTKQGIPVPFIQAITHRAASAIESAFICAADVALQHATAAIMERPNGHEALISMLDEVRALKANYQAGAALTKASKATQPPAAPTNGAAG